MLVRLGGVIRPHALWFPDDITIPAGVDEATRLPPDMARGLFTYRLFLRRGLMRVALDESINSGQFLDYDVTSSAFIVGPLQRSLLELRGQIESFESLVDGVNTNATIAQDTSRLGDAVRARINGEVVAFTARMLYASWSAAMNVLRLSRAVYRVLSGLDRGIEEPELQPRYAPDEKDKIEAERVTDGEAEAWLRSLDWRIEPQGEHSN